VAAGAAPQAAVKINRNSIPVNRAVRFVNIFFSFWFIQVRYEKANNRMAFLLFAGDDFKS
jgi:hypothetical protein